MVEKIYIRPVFDTGPSPFGRALGASPLRFSAVELRRRDTPAEVLPVEAAEALYGAESMARLTGPRAILPGLPLQSAAIMGVVNVTPDSFSDGGLYAAADTAVEHGLLLAEQGASILDIGGESTRPGAEPVPEAAERDRVIPVIEGLIAAGCTTPISIDTRKAGVARAAIDAGAVLFNDVSAFTHDPGSAAVSAPAYCLMHAQGDPRTMQANPAYDDVLLDVYDFLEARIAAAENAGIPRSRIMIDPGIGFGKTLTHNLALIRGLGLFHALGCPVLLGVSRKRFIGTISGASEASERAPGSIAAGLWGLSQGAQMLRVHDVAETVQAVRVWQALLEDTQ